MSTKTTIGILGIGNTLLQDEGFGPHAVELFEERYQIPDNVKVLDGGTAGILLAPFVESVNILYIIDTVDISAEPGTIHCFSGEEIYSKDIQTRLSPHQVGLIEIIDLCKLRDKAPDQYEMLTVVPEKLSVGIGLSAKLNSVIDTMLNLIVERLGNHDIYLQKAISTKQHCM